MKQDTLSIVIAIAAFVYAGVRLYMKYGKKTGGQKQDKPSGGGMPVTKNTDEYEPYSKR
jgi:hypothetical protein